MSPCSYYESMSVPEVLFYTMSPCLYHESLSNPCFHFYTMRNAVFRYTEIQITTIKKYKFQNYISLTCIFTEIQITVIQKYQIIEIQFVEVQKYKWHINRKIPVFLVAWIWSELTLVADSEHFSWIMNPT